METHWEFKVVGGRDNVDLGIALPVSVPGVSGAIVLLPDENRAARPRARPRIDRSSPMVLSRSQRFRFAEKLREFIVNFHGPISHVYPRWKNPEFASEEGVRIYDSPLTHDSPFAVPDSGGRPNACPTGPWLRTITLSQISSCPCLIPMNPPSCFPIFFVTYEHDVSIYDLWNVSSSPPAPPVPQMVKDPKKRSERSEAT